jgi:hypothetical protein
VWGGPCTIVTLKQYRIQISDSSRALPLLVLSYAVLMTHFVFSRAFRDSLLGSHLAISSLPGLTVLGTLLAISLSLLLSFFVRSSQRIVVIRLLFALLGLVELWMAWGYQSHPWIYGAYYMQVSASTALGLSLIWILIGDWTNRCNARKDDRIPTILICGTAAGMFGGLGLVHIPGVLNFGIANAMLASMHLVVAFALLLYRDEFCHPAEETVSEVIARGRALLAGRVVQALALVTVLGATTSTLLDLVFRVATSETYTQQAGRLHFFGLFQSILCLGALLSQLVMNRLQRMKLGIAIIHLHPMVVAVAGCMAALWPGFWAIGAFRLLEYSLRNSTFRMGTERTYMALPDETRVEVRPLVDVVGERVGDMIAAGFLQLLLIDNAHLPPIATPLAIAGCSVALYVVCRILEGKADEMAKAAQRARAQVSLEGIAKESSVLV